MLATYADDLLSYCNGIEHMENTLVAKEKLKKLEVQSAADTTDNYWMKRRTAERARIADAVAKASLEKIRKDAVKKKLTKLKNMHYR